MKIANCDCGESYWVNASGWPAMCRCGKKLEHRPLTAEEVATSSPFSEGLAGPSLTWGELKQIALEREVPDDFIMEIIIGNTAPVRFDRIMVIRDDKIFVMHKPC